MKIYTKTGDKGETSLFGGRRVPKDALRIEAYGTIDEVNSVVGMAVALSRSHEMREMLTGLQRQLFEVGADLATPRDDRGKEIRRISPEDAAKIEQLIDSLELNLPPLHAFILPGGTPVASALHHARAVSRRAERLVVRLARTEPVGEALPVYINRFSDLLFVLARYSNQLENTPDIEWKK